MRFAAKPRPLAPRRGVARRRDPVTSKKAAVQAFAPIFASLYKTKMPHYADDKSLTHEVLMQVGPEPTSAPTPRREPVANGKMDANDPTLDGPPRAKRRCVQVIWRRGTAAAEAVGVETTPVEPGEGV